MEVAARIPRCEEALTKLLEYVQRSAQSGEVAPVTAASLFAPAPSKASVPVDVEIAFVTAPTAHRVPMYAPLPHAALDGTICVVTPSPQRKYKDIVAAAAADGDALAARVRKVIEAKKLAAKFQDPVALRALANAFDHFVLHPRLRRFPRLLTGEFLTHQRPPVWAPRAGTFLQCIAGATRTAVVPRRGHSFVTVRVGHAGMPVAELVANVAALLDFLTNAASNRDAISWNSFLTVNVAAGGSTATKRASLPIYSHDFAQSHPGVLLDAAAAAPPAAAPQVAAAAAPAQPPNKKRRK